MNAFSDLNALIQLANNESASKDQELQEYWERYVERRQRTEWRTAYDYGFACDKCSANVSSKDRRRLVNNCCPQTLCSKCFETWRTFKNRPVPVEYTCDLGHTFTREEAPGLGGVQRRCPYCNNDEVLAGFNDMLTLAPELAQMITSHDPSTLINGRQYKCSWTCEHGHKWDMDTSTMRMRMTRMENVPTMLLCPTCTINKNRNLPLDTPAMVPTGSESVPERGLNDLLSLGTVLAMVPRTEKNRFFRQHAPVPRFNTIDMAGEYAGYKVFIEYDGCYWHANKKHTDQEKTLGILAHEKTLVVRVRENSLFSLEIDHPRYFELNATPDALSQAVEQIEAWVQSKG